ncbi:carboxyl transferase domain-containing protein [Phthorimaea operculella]|nr:carboxyl transferase domain-containing protein [Phthorimaea operculella]
MTRGADARVTLPRYTSRYPLTSLPLTSVTPREGRAQTWRTIADGTSESRDSNCINVIGDYKTLVDSDEVPLEPIHILMIGVRDSGESDDTVMSRRFGNFCRAHRHELHQKRIRRVTFMSLIKRQFPKFFTYRARNDFTEDTIYRHLEPASAFQLELYRMRSYELEALPTSNQKMHLYLGKAKVKKGQEVTDYRFFIRSIIRHQDLITKEASFEYLQNEGERVLLEAMDELEVAFSHPLAKRTDCNHIFLNFGPTVIMDPAKIEESVLGMVMRYGPRLWKLRVLQAEIRFTLRIGPGAPTKNVRLCLSNGSGYSLDVFTYEEVSDPRTGVIMFHSYGHKQGPMHGLPISTPYVTKDYLQQKRFLATSQGTTYVYDIPDMFRQIVEKRWRECIEEGSIVEKRWRECVEEGSQDGPIPDVVMTCVELVVEADGERRLVEVTRLPGQNTVGMVAWRMTLYTPEVPTGRDIVLIANDLTHYMGSFGPLEDWVYYRASQYARELKIPRIYISVNSGARIGVAEEVKSEFNVAWIDPERPERGFKYLYLSPESFSKLGPLNSVKTQLIEDDGESRYKITDIIGKEDGLGVECLRDAGLIAGETAQAYEDVVTISVVTCRAIGIGSYVVRLGHRVIQVDSSYIILTGYAALNKVLGRAVYASNNQLGGVQIMHNNGVSHAVAPSDLEAITTCVRWLSYVPKVTITHTGNRTWNCLHQIMHNNGVSHAVAPSDLEAITTCVRWLSYVPKVTIASTGNRTWNCLHQIMHNNGVSHAVAPSDLEAITTCARWLSYVPKVAVLCAQGNYCTHRESNLELFTSEEAITTCARWLSYVPKVAVLCAQGNYCIHRESNLEPQRKPLPLVSGGCLMCPRWLSYVPKVTIAHTGNRTWNLRGSHYHLCQVAVLCAQGNYCTHRESNLELFTSEEAITTCARWLSYVPKVAVLCAQGNYCTHRESNLELFTSEEAITTCARWLSYVPKVTIASTGNRTWNCLHQIMHNNGVSHAVAPSDLEAITTCVRWLSYVPKVTIAHTGNRTWNCLHQIMHNNGVSTPWLLRPGSHYHLCQVAVLCTQGNYCTHRESNLEPQRKPLPLVSGGCLMCPRWLSYVPKVTIAHTGNRTWNCLHQIMHNNGVSHAVAPSDLEAITTCVRWLSYVPKIMHNNGVSHAVAPSDLEAITTCVRWLSYVPKVAVLCAQGNYCIHRESNLEPQIMHNNGVSHAVAPSDLEAITTCVRWLSYVPKVTIASTGNRTWNCLHQIMHNNGVSHAVAPSDLEAITTCVRWLSYVPKVTIASTGNRTWNLRSCITTGVARRGSSDLEAITTCVRWLSYVPKVAVLRAQGNYTNYCIHRESNLEPQIMHNNGVSHAVAPSDLEAITTCARWL